MNTLQSGRRRAATCLAAALAALTISPHAAADPVGPRLVDRAGAAGLAVVENTWSATPGDYDRDGRLDVLLVFHQHSDGRLMHNNGDGTYTRVAPNIVPKRNAAGGVLDRHDCAWGDVDNNGLLDAYCTGGRNQSNYVKTPVKDNELWMQIAPGQFVDRGTERGVGEPCGRGRYAAFLDVNRDGWTDLFVGNQKGRAVADPTCDAMPTSEESKVYLNHEGTGFTYSKAWKVNDPPSSGTTCAFPWDFNHDGLIDLFACHFDQVPQLFRNTGTGFVQVAGSMKLASMTDATTGDLDGDGLRDLVYSANTGFFYRLGTPTGLGPAVRLGAALPGNVRGNGIAVGDIDGNGRPDVYGLEVNPNSSTNPDDVVFMNRGMVFTAMHVPSAVGDGDCVATVRSLSSGPDEFLVMNGRENRPGPVQLIAYVAG